MNEKSVLIIGGGVAALSAAAALVEQNKNALEGVPQFKITIATSDDLWGGRACSWRGGEVRKRYERDPDPVPAPGPPGPKPRPHYSLHEQDFRMWPEELPLNHGFHAVFDESTYVNFWHTLDLAGVNRDQLKGKDLISNRSEILVYESETQKVCRLKIKRLPWIFHWIPYDHLAYAALELWLNGGWTISQIYAFGVDVMLYMNKYRFDFQGLANLDDFHRISFEKWCRDRGVPDGIFSKMMFKFLFQGTYIAPNTMDATSGLMGLWTILRHAEAANWYYINGGITEKLMNPIVDSLRTAGVELLNEHKLLRFRTTDTWQSIDSCEFEYRTQQVNPKRYDYYINTLPLDSSVGVFKESVTDAPKPAPLVGSGVAIVAPPSNPSTLLEVFPDVAMLEQDKRFPDTAGTVNLQAWFNRKGLLSNRRNRKGDYRNVVAGLEPLCVIVDYKGLLPMYDDDTAFPGSVLEINGSLQELQSPEHYGYFECDPRFGEPHEEKTIELARSIMIDLARRYLLPELLDAVEKNDFLLRPTDWPGRIRWPGHDDKVPPFLWKNTDPYNRFFVTGPGTLHYRPWISRARYNEEHEHRKAPGYRGPDGYPKNFFFAGDWTRNGFDTPCMEGAARAGRQAALAVLKTEIGKDATVDPTAPKEPQRDGWIEIFEPR